MPHYSPERKEAILQKMVPPQSLTVAVLSSQEGISTATLYNWRTAARKRGAVLPSNPANADKWSSEEKFRIALETAPMTVAELSEYCRKHCSGSMILNRSKLGKQPA
jgi:transposase-like protein